MALLTRSQTCPESVATGIHELRIDYGLGYRVDYVRRGTALILLLADGDRRSQQRDIRRAETIARDLDGGYDTATHSLGPR